MADYFYSLSMLIPGWHRSPADWNRSLKQELADEEKQ